MSRVYNARNACTFLSDEFSNHSDESDFIYITDNDTVLQTTCTADHAAMDTLNRSYGKLEDLLNCTPLVVPCSQGSMHVSMINSLLLTNSFWEATI